MESMSGFIFITGNLSSIFSAESPTWMIASVLSLSVFMTRFSRPR